MENEIILTDEYKLNRNTYGWTLEFLSSEVKMVRTPKTGAMVESRESWRKFYGGLYQALQGFSKYYYENSNSISEVINKVMEARSIIKDSLLTIKELNQELYDEYRTIKVSKN
jgi:hypothetical protein